MLKNKSILFSILIWVFRTCISIIVLLSLFCIFLYYKYQINVFVVGSYIKIINEPVSTERLLTNPYTNEDIEYIKKIISCEDNGISLTESALRNIVSTESLDLTDKQVGALLYYLIEEQKEIKIQIGSEINLKDYGFKVMQVDFSDINDNSVIFNIVLKVELKKVKEKMVNFPLNLIAKSIPNELYFSSSVKILRGEGVDYTTESENMIINNLSKEETENIFKTINTFLKIGDASEFNKILGDTFVNILIGNEASKGFVYGLSEEGVVSKFYFESKTTGESLTDYIILKK